MERIYVVHLLTHSQYFVLRYFKTEKAANKFVDTILNTPGVDNGIYLWGHLYFNSKDDRLVVAHTDMFDEENCMNYVFNPEDERKELYS